MLAEADVQRYRDESPRLMWAMLAVGAEVLLEQLLRGGLLTRVHGGIEQLIDATWARFRERSDPGVDLRAIEDQLEDLRQAAGFRVPLLQDRDEFVTGTGVLQALRYFLAVSRWLSYFPTGEAPSALAVQDLLTDKGAFAFRDLYWGARRGGDVHAAKAYLARRIRLRFSFREGLSAAVSGRSWTS